MGADPQGGPVRIPLDRLLLNFLASVIAGRSTVLATLEPSTQETP